MPVTCSKSALLTSTVAVKPSISDRSRQAQTSLTSAPAPDGFFLLVFPDSGGNAIANQASGQIMGRRHFPWFSGSGRPVAPPIDSAEATGESTSLVLPPGIPPNGQGEGKEWME